MLLTTIRITAVHGTEELILDQPNITHVPALGDEVACFGGKAIVTARTIIPTSDGNRSILLHAEMQSRILSSWGRLFAF